jgi:hypothetical protein
MDNIIALEFCRVPLAQIDRDDKLTDFSLGAAPSLLETSIREIGVTHPLLLVRRSAGYRIVSGHRRFLIAARLGFSDIPAQILTAAGDASMLETNLIENSRQYSDVEKGLIARKLRDAGVPEDRIISRHMPFLGLERSKKLYADFIQVETLTPGLRLLLHELNVPVRVFSLCFGWDAQSLSAVETLFAELRPGINKWRELLELVDETARRDDIKVADLLLRQEIQSIPKDLPVNEKYDRVYQALYQRRYPALWDLKKRALLTLDRLKLDDKIKIRAAENFENGEIKVEFKFTTQEELKSYVEQLSGVSGSEPIAALIKVFKDVK